MNPTKETTTFFEILETIINGGTEEFREILRYLYNAAMRIERNQFLQAEPYQRCEERRRYAKGFKSARIVKWKKGKNPVPDYDGYDVIINTLAKKSLDTFWEEYNKGK